MEDMGLNPKNNPISVIFKTRQREGTFLKEKEPNSGNFQKKRRQDKIKAEAKRILWTEKQVSITLLCVELKMQNEIFHLGAPMSPKATLRVPHLCINSAWSLLPECPLITYQSD